MCKEKWIAGILAAIGVFYALMPHSTHVSTGLGFGLTHDMHAIIGIALVLVGAIVYFTMGRKADAKKGASRAPRRARRAAARRKRR